MPATVASGGASPVVVRFAPSPTGYLHLGNARTAVVNWLFARRHGGRVILRLDDTDGERSSEAYAAGIREDLGWLGLAWDEEHRQSARRDVHLAAFERLRDAGRAYPAFETAEELGALRASQRARGLPPRYDRRALALDEAERQRLEAGGRIPHWRFRLSEGEVAFDDLARGPQHLALKHLSDPVIRRADGAFTYGFASVVDDIDLGISHVIRGEDHLTNTAVHIDLARVLGAAPPTFAHLPLILDVSGGKLSKRLEGLSLRALRADGIEPGAVLALLATLGTGGMAPVEGGLASLAAGFDFAAFGNAQPRLDPADLARLSAAMLRAMPFAAVVDRLRALGLSEADAAFWEAVRANLDRLEDAAGWWRILREPLVPEPTDSELTGSAAELLERGVDLEGWLPALRERTGRKGKALFQPLRLALTGREHGPPLPDLVALIGRDRAARRLRGETC